MPSRTTIIKIGDKGGILDVKITELPEELKNEVEKVVIDFEDKCMMSFSRTRDNKIMQKFPLPRVSLLGQRDQVDDYEKRIMLEGINESVNNALCNHNTMFLTTLRNLMKEVLYGAPVYQEGPAYFNIPQPLAEAAIASTSKQPVVEEVPQASDSLQVQQSSGQSPQQSQTQHAQQLPAQHTQSSQQQQSS